MKSLGMGAAVVLLAMAGATTARAEGDLAAAPRIKLEEFKKALDQDKVLVIDTRSAGAYRAGHIPGSINVPLSTWDQNLPRLKASPKPIVAYCACPAEQTAARAALRLDEAGVKNARALVGGYHAWVGAGYALVKGDQPR